MQCRVDTYPYRPSLFFRRWPTSLPPSPKDSWEGFKLKNKASLLLMGTTSEAPKAPEKKITFVEDLDDAGAVAAVCRKGWIEQATQPAPSSPFLSALSSSSLKISYLPPFPLPRATCRRAWSTWGTPAT